MCLTPRKRTFRLGHMREAVDRILLHTGGLSREELSHNRQAINAAAWNLMVLGETARHIPPGIADTCFEVPWPQMRGTRNRIVQGYNEIDFEII